MVRVIAHPWEHIYMPATGNDIIMMSIFHQYTAPLMTSFMNAQIMAKMMSEHELKKLSTWVITLNTS
jgi:hypothetical protein